MGPAVTRAFTLTGAAVGAGLLTATSAASELADQMANVATVVPTADIAGLTDEVQALSRATGQTTTDLTGGLYDLVSAGVSAEDAMGVLAASTNLAIGGLGTTAGAADIVTSAMNAYGLAASEAGSITDVFALAIQKGKVTADEIGASIANIAPVAAAAGVSLEEVSAGYAALTAKGVPAAQAATQMRAAISALLTPNEQLNRIQEQTGLNFAELARTEGLGVSLEKLRQSFADNGDSLAKLAGVAEEDFPDALRSMQDELGLANSDIEKLTAIAGEDGAAFALAELAKTAGQSDSGFAKALGSIEAYQFALNTTGANAESFQETIGEMYDSTGTAAEQAAIKMDSPVEAGKRLVATFQTFLQDVGGPFASSLGPIVFAFNQMGPAMGGVIRLSTILGGGLGALAGKFVALAITGVPAVLALVAPFLPIILIVGAVVAVVAALFFAWQNNLFGIRDIAENVWNAVSGFVGGAVEFITDVIGNVIDFISGIWDGVVSAARSVWDSITGVIRGAVGAVMGIIGGLIGFVGGVADAIGGFFDFITGGTNRAKTQLGGLSKNVATPTGQFATANLGGTRPVRRYQMGAWETADEFAYLHAGEMVLPPDLAEGFRRFFGGGGWEMAPARADGGGRGGDTIVEHMEVVVPIQGLLRAEHPSDIADVLRRAAARGYLTPRPVRTGAG